MTIVVSNELDNLIIGGDFNTNPWQRGTSFVSPTTLDYTADRFQYRVSGSQDFTITKDVDNPAFSEFGLLDSFSLDAEVTTANAVPAIGDFTTIEQPIEGFMAIPVYDNPFGISFWVKSALAGVYCVAFQNAARDRNYIAEYTIASADVWQEVEIQVVHDSSGGTWEIGNLAGLRVIFTLNAGATLQGAANTWQAGDLVATVNQVNLSATLANTFRIALVRCIHGIPGTAYFMRDAGRELAFCQRYYQKSYNQGVDPTTSATVGMLSGNRAVAGTTILELQNSFQTIMRDVPTVSWYSTVTGAINNVRNVSEASDKAISSTLFAGDRSTGSPDLSVAPSANDLFEAHFTAEAEI